MLPRSLSLTWAVWDGRRSAPAPFPRRLTAFAHQPPLLHVVIRTAHSRPDSIELPRSLMLAWALQGGVAVRGTVRGRGNSAGAECRPSWTAHVNVSEWGTIEATRTPR